MSASSTENKDLDTTIGHFINGENTADNNRLQDVTNPATGQVARQVAMASTSTVEDAIAAAQAAFPAWRNTPPANQQSALRLCLGTNNYLNNMPRK